MKNTIKLILLLLNDIYWIFKISKEEFFDIVEILSFGLVINAIKVKKPIQFGGYIIVKKLDFN